MMSTVNEEEKDRARERSEEGKEKSSPAAHRSGRVFEGETRIVAGWAL
jgi:hypothetical protein